MGGGAAIHWWRGSGPPPGRCGAASPSFWTNSPGSTEAPSPASTGPRAGCWPTPQPSASAPRTPTSLSTTCSPLRRALADPRGPLRVTSQDPEAPLQALEQSGRDLVDLARRGKLDPVIGRDEEIRRVIQVLSRRTKNNPVL